MDYAGHYQRLIDRARNRAVSGYVERHHVLPRCMGGSDEPANLVDLTPEEHYVAHQLLVKMHPENYRLVYAAHAMTMQGPYHERSKNKLYGWLRRRMPEALDGPHKQKQSAAKKRRPLSEAHRAALRAAGERTRERNAAKIRQRYAKYLPSYGTK